MERECKIQDTINRSITKDFTQIPNQLLRNPAISGKAKSILCLLLLSEAKWDIHFATMRQMMKEGDAALQSGVRELEKHNYLLRIRYRDKQTNHLVGSFWAYTDTPGKFNLSENLQTLKSMNLEPVNFNMKNIDKGAK